MNKYISIIQDVVDDIEGHLTSPITVTQLALKSGISNWQFQRIFKSIVGESIGNYLRCRRLTSAAQVLQSTEQKILDIAIEYQFNSQEAFSRPFKNYFGMTPKEMRLSKSVFATKKKPVITPALLDHLNGGITLLPKIVTRPKTLLVGMETKITSVFSNYQDFSNSLVPHWNKFFASWHKIKKSNAESCIGLLKFNNENLEEDEYVYLSALSVSSLKNVPSEMVTYEIPEQQYAVFTNKGLGNKTSLTINYIYGTWLPQSDFLRSDADDFELFDKRYSLKKESSISDYYLPIKDPSI